jgi:hypothetical protein
MRPNIFNRTFLLIAPLLLTAFVSRASAGAQTVVQLQSNNRGYSIVQVSINGSGPYPFLLDMGANRTLIQNELLNILKITPGDLVPVNMATGVTYLRRTVVSSLAVAGLAVHDLQIEGIDSDKLTRISESVQGILGEDFLKHFDLLIDNHARNHIQTLILDSTSNLAHSLAGDRLPLSFSGTRDGHPTKDRLVFDLKLPNSPEPAHFLIDSGANHAMFFPPKPRSSQQLGAPAGTLQTMSGSSHCHSEFVPLAVGKEDVGPVDVAFCDGMRANVDVDGFLPTSTFKRLFISHSGAYLIANPRQQKPAANALAKSSSQSPAQSASGT